MTTFDVYAVRKTEMVLAETWGHLAPKPHRTYPGTVLFAVSAYPEPVCLIEADFTGLPDSPWLYEAMNLLIDAEAASVDYRPGVYRFTGTATQRDSLVLAGTTERIEVSR